MSLVSDILFRAPPPKFKGRKRSYICEGSSNTGRDFNTEGDRRNAERNTAIRMRNVERCYESVRKGNQTIPEVERDTGLSESTVKKALHELVDWHGGPRVLFTRKANRHFYKAVE